MFNTIREFIKQRRARRWNMVVEQRNIERQRIEERIQHPLIDSDTFIRMKRYKAIIEKEYQRPFEEVLASIPTGMYIKEFAVPSPEDHFLGVVTLECSMGCWLRSPRIILGMKS